MYSYDIIYLFDGLSWHVTAGQGCFIAYQDFKLLLLTKVQSLAIVLNEAKTTKFR